VGNKDIQTNFTGSKETFREVRGALALARPLASAPASTSDIFFFLFHIILFSILYLFLHGIKVKFLWPLTNIIAYFVVICGSIHWRILAQCGLAFS
jgi:hypothetical protein